MRSRWRGAVVYGLYLAVTGAVGGYVLWLGQRSLAAYRFLKSDHLGFHGRVHRADAELGFAAIPSAQGFHVFPIGPPLPMRYDADGFRVPAFQGDPAPRQRPLVLALGCSYTYGDGCLAENTYPYLVAERLGGSALNAGKCAYGLSQMLLLARRLIPQYRPDYVLVQFSPWLASRGTSGFARATFGDVPVPFLMLQPDGRVDTHPPAFASRVFELPFDRYDNRGTGEFASFFFKAGAPLFVHDDAQRFARALLGWREKSDEAARRQAAGHLEAVNRVVYREIGEICRREGATMVIVRLSHPLERYWQRLAELSPGAVVVNAQTALDRQAADRDAYYRRFAHWRGAPAVMVDTHPNPAAHRLVAEEVVQALKNVPRAGPSPVSRLPPGEKVASR
jgi:hypothetical protein